MKQVNYRINVTTASSDKNIKKTEKNVKGLGKGVKSVNKSTTNLNDSLAVMPGSIGRVVQSFKALKVALLSSGIGAIIVAVGALTGLFAAATKKGADFAKQMSTLKAVSGASAEQMNALSESAKELGSSTQFTAIQVGELQTEFAKMGFSTQQILDSTKATLDLAASMEVDLASAAMLAGSTVNAFGLEAEDTQRVVDVLAKSTSSSALDFGSLTESLKMAAPIAKSTGVSIEETAAMLGVLANTGIKGSLAGTGLSKTFIELNKKGIDLKDALDTVNKSSNGLNTAIDLVGQVGAKSLLNLASKSEDIDKLTVSLQESEGAAAAMAEVRLDNLAGDTTKLSSAFEGFLLSIEDGGGLFSKIARLFVQFATSFLTGITKMSNFFGAFISEFNESFAVFHNLKLSASIAIDSIVLGFLNLKGVVAEIPFIGKAIDKKALEESKEATIQSIKESSEGIAYWNGIAEKRRESGLGFFERVNERTKKMAIAAEQKITEAKEVETEKREIISEDEAEKERKRLQKLAEERIKAERKRIQNIAKLEGELFAEIEKLDEEARRRKQTAQQNEIDDLNEKYFKLLNDTRLGEEEKLRLQEYFREQEQAINDKYDKIAEDSQKKIAEQEKKTNEERIKGEQTVLEKKLQMTSDALGAISQLVTAFAGADEAEQKKAFKINKALSIAQALVNTALSVTAALTAGGNPIKLATGAQFVEAGIAAALGAAQVAAIAKTRFESSGGGGSSAPSSSLGGAAGGLGSQAPAFNVVGQSGFNQVAQALGQQNSTPIKAFVVSGDVTSAQALENNIIDTATF
jgi:hypothetical protein